MAVFVHFLHIAIDHADFGRRDLQMPDHDLDRVLAEQVVLRQTREELAPRDGVTAVVCLRNAAIAFVTDDPQAAIFRRIGAGDFGVILRTFVIHNDNFDVAVRLLEAALDGFRQKAAALVARDDNGN